MRIISWTFRPLAVKAKVFSATRILSKCPYSPPIQLFYGRLYYDFYTNLIFVNYAKVLLSSFIL